MYEFIVFDLDGTLLDTLADLHASVNFALEKFSFPKRSQEEVRSFVGNGIAMLIKRAIGKQTPLFEDVLQAFKTHYAVHCADKTQPYKGILPLLEQLKMQGVKTAVVSNKADFAVKKLADEYFGGLFLAAVGEDEANGIRKKPAPDSLLSVLQKLGADKQKTVYVGDSEVDIQTAQNAGVACISVAWGFKDKDFLIENGATVLIDAPDEILKYCIQ